MTCAKNIVNLSQDAHETQDAGGVSVVEEETKERPTRPRIGRREEMLAPSHDSKATGQMLERVARIGVVAKQTRGSFPEPRCNSPSITPKPEDVGQNTLGKYCFDPRQTIHGTNSKVISIIWKHPGQFLRQVVGGGEGRRRGPQKVSQ
jgi:hypothetical protein